MAKFIRFLICSALAIGVYYLFFKTQIVSKWGVWPGSPFDDFELRTWIVLFVRWLIFNKFAGYYWVTVFIIGALGFLFDKPDKCDKCGSENIEYGEVEITAEEFKHANKDSGPDLRYKKNAILQLHSVTDKCKKCSHEWTNEWVEEKVVLMR